MTNNLILIPACIVSFLCGAAGAYFLIRFRVHSIVNEERYTYYKAIGKNRKSLHLSFLPLIVMLKKHKDHYKREMGDLVNSLQKEASKSNVYIEELKELENRLKNADRQILELNRVIKGAGMVLGRDKVKPSEAVPHIQKTGTNQTVKPLVLYFGIPDSDGNFSVKDGVAVADDRNLYKIVSDKAGETGELHFISGQFDLKAIDNIDYYLMPVCEVENIHDRNFASKIFQRESGKVVKKADRWITEKKVKIKLI